MDSNTGRPTKYDPSMIEIAEKYMQDAIPQNMKIPTIEGLALRLNVNRDTLYEWKKQHKEFSDTLDKLQILQKEHLTETGIFGGKEINANIVSLLLKVNHGMVETEKKILAGDKEQPLEYVIKYEEDKKDGNSRNNITEKVQELPEAAGDIPNRY